MELPLVVGADGSECSLQAVDWATQEAARRGLPLRLVHASLWQRYEDRDGSGDGQNGGAVRADPADAGVIVARAAERARAVRPDVPVETDVLCEEADEALLAAARNATLLVVGARGCGAVPGLVLGTVALATAVRASCPVVVVRGSARNQHAAHGTVLLAAGGRASGTAAVDFAFREAGLRHSVLRALRAWRCPASLSAGRLRWPQERARRQRERAARLLDDALEPAAGEHPGTGVVREVVEGPAHEVLLDRTHGADLVVVGARRPHHDPGARLGRVAHTMLHYADCPVAVVPHRA